MFLGHHHRHHLQLRLILDWMGVYRVVEDPNPDIPKIKDKLCLIKCVKADLLLYFLFHQIIITSFVVIVNILSRSSTNSPNIGLSFGW